MKLAYIRGDFLSSWEISNSSYLAARHDFTLFIGKKPVNPVAIPKNMKVVSLFSPADLNFGSVKKYRMALLNRLFVDAHFLFGLEEKLKGLDIAYVSETFYGFTHQALEAKKMGYVKKVVSHASENTPFNNESIFGRKAFKDQAVSEMDKFIALTKGAKEVLIKEGAASDKIVSLYPGVDQKLFRPLSVSRFRHLEKSKNIKLLFVGRLVPEKGILELISKYQKLSKKIANIELVIAGSGPLRDTIETLSAQDKKITYLDYVPYQELGQLYNLCDIFLHYSIGSKTWVEQYGFTLLEAMSCGLPILALNRGSVAELLDDAGFAVSERDFDDILEKIVKNKRQREEIGKKAAIFAKKNYDAEKHGQDLEKLFKNILRS